MDKLPKQIADLVLAGRKIEAIQLLRESTGMGLAEARDAIEAAASGQPQPPPSGPVHDVPPDVREAALAGNRIEAIKRLRQHTGLGLKEAKDEIDRLFPTPTGKRGCLLPLLFGGLIGIGALFVRGG